MRVTETDILEIFGEASGLGRKAEWFDAAAGFGCITRRGRKRSADDLRAEGNRRRSAANYRRVLASPVRHAKYKLRRRAWWRRTNPLPPCVDCGAPTTSGHAKRCSACLPTWRRKLAADRQRRFKARLRLALEAA